MSMNIDPAVVLGQPQELQARGVEPDVNDVQVFAAAMAARAARPERAAVDAVRQAEAAASARVKATAGAVPLDAGSMLKVQRALLEMRSEVDVIAKVAGTLSQSINKLTTMQ